MDRKEMYMSKDQAITELCKNVKEFRLCLLSLLDAEEPDTQLFLELVGSKKVFPLIRLMHLLDYIDWEQEQYKIRHQHTESSKSPLGYVPETDNPPFG